MKIAERQEFKSKPKPLTCTKETSIREAAQMMAAQNYGSIVVVGDDERVIGMLTERDFLNRVVAEGKDVDALTVADIMTDRVRVARGDDDLLEWLRIMSNERFRRLPVVDGDGKLINIVTQGDFVSYTWPDLISQAKTFVASSASNNRQILFVAGAILAYTAALLIFISVI
ncbi:MAG: CBS domain-containing protein [Sphingomonadales bacterium]